MRDLVVGVDGAHGGWVAVALGGGRFAGAAFLPSFVEVLAWRADAAAVAVDIPIGLPTRGHREADLAAKRFLRRRPASVFLTPPREALEAATHREASTTGRRLTGKGVSQQAFALRGKILEVDALVRTGDRIIEVHPEVSFEELAGATISGSPLASKKTWNGLMRRRELLARGGIRIPAHLPGVTAQPDDVLDAAAAAWSALRYSRGEAESLPLDPPRDRRGRLVAIWR